jgi:hypothetical protein
VQPRSWIVLKSSFDGSAGARSVPLQMSMRFQSFTTGTSDKEKEKDEGNEDSIVYESPLGNVVSRLRTVSLCTGVIGTLGLPLIIAAKGGDLPSTGMLATGLLFVAGSLGSTAAIYFVFSPYAYTIESIPIRKCHYVKKESTDESESETDGEEKVVVEQKTDPAAKKKDVLLKAFTKSLFLTRTDTVFDPATDVVAYKGLRPLCNLLVKGKPMYVHPEFVYDETLRKLLNLDAKEKPLKEEDDPDDLF